MRTAKAVLFLLAAAVVIGAAWLAFQYFNHGSESKAEAAAPTHLNARELRFSADSPQLSFIKAEPVEALPEPLLDPLSARIAYDENHTARISSPIAGRVTRILAQPGDRVAAGRELLQIDAPDFASAAADVAKSRADLQLKQKAFARARELFEAE